MDVVSQNIAANIKYIRKERHLTLDDAAEITGVSKSMLGQIERGDSNPTIGTLNKIAAGLKISISALMAPPKSETAVARRSEFETIYSSKDMFSVYSIFPYDSESRFSLNSVEVTEGGSYSPESLPESAYIYIVVAQGEMLLKIDDDVHIASCGDAMRIAGDKRCVLFNSGKGILRVTAFVVFSGNEKNF